MLHRALLGSLERFYGILEEHYAGAFPLWLSPVQAVLIPIADRHLEYARQVAAQLKQAGMRVKVDDGGDRMNAKIRLHTKQHVPYMLVVGDKEAENGQVAPRTREGEDLGAMKVADFIQRVEKEVKDKK